MAVPKFIFEKKAFFLAFLAVLLLLQGAPYAQAPGQKGVQTFAPDGVTYDGCSSPPCIFWANLPNAEARDGAYSTSTFDASHIQSYGLQPFNYPFNIPAGARIDGIALSIYRHASVANAISDLSVYVVPSMVTARSNGPSGTNYAKAGFWTTSDQYATYGGPTDLWGQTWKWGDINYIYFSPYIKAQSSTPAQALVDYVNLSVYYTASGPPSVASATITPSSADANTGFLQCLNGSTTSPLGEPVSLTYTWYRSGNGGGGWGVVSHSSAVYNNNYYGPPDATSFNIGDIFYCAITPHTTDFDGTPVNSPTLTIQGPALPTITKPTITPANPTASDTLTCNVGAVSNPGNYDGITIYLNWTVNGNKLAVHANTLSNGYFNAGDTVTCLTYVRGTISGSLAVFGPPNISDPVTITFPPPPTITKPTLTPANPNITSTLTCTAGTVSNPSGYGSLYYVFNWSVNGVDVLDSLSSVQSGSGSDTLTNTHFNPGDTVVCLSSVRGFLSGVGTVIGPQSASNTVTIYVPTPPTSAKPVITPTNPTSSTTLTCTAGAISNPSGYTTLYYQFNWTTNGVLQQSIIQFNSDPTRTITPASGHFTTGDSVVCTVSVRGTLNGIGTITGPPISSDPAIIGGNVPYLTSQPVITPDPAYYYDLAGPLDCTNVTAVDPSGKSINIYYYYYILHQDGTSSFRSRSTLSTLPLSYLSPNDTVTCEVTPRNSLGVWGDPVNSTPVFVHDSSAPVVSGARVTPNPAYLGLLAASCPLRCVYDNITSPHQITSITYAWYRTRAGKTVKNTYSPPSPDCVPSVAAYIKVGDLWKCQVTATDNAGLKGGMNSSPVTILAGAPPNTTRPTVTPNPAYQTTAFLTCTNGTTLDPNGLSVSFAYQWFKNSMPIALSSSRTLQNSSYAKGDVIVCQITPSDSQATGFSQNSTPLVVFNSPPNTSTPTLLPPSASKSTQNISCVNGTTSDPDNDPVSFFYLWFKNNASTGITSNNITNSSFTNGDKIACQITPTDGAANGTSRNSTTIIVGSQVPVTSPPILSPIPAFKSTLNITCSNNTTTDPTGSNVSFSYLWFKNNASTNITLQNLSNANFAKNDNITCQITPNNSIANGTAVNSSVLKISNSPPNTSIPTLSPSPAYKSTALINCTNGTSFDVDNDPVAFYYAWFDNNITIAGATKANLTNASFGKGDTIICQITPFDGFINGTSFNSTGLKISGTPPTVPNKPFITPSNAYKNTMLNANFAGAPGSIDPDGGTVTIYYYWTNSVLNPPGTASSTSPAASNAFNCNNYAWCKKGTPIFVAAMGSTASGNSSYNFSDSITINNTPPYMASVAIDPSVVYSNTPSIQCYGSAGDIDSDPLSYNYSWFNNSVPIAGAHTQYLYNTQYAQGDSITCQMTPIDSSNAAGAPMASAAVVVQPPSPCPDPSEIYFVACGCQPAGTTVCPAAPPSAFVGTCSATITPSNMSAIVISLLTVIFLIALAYMYGQFTRSVRAEVWAKDELVNLVVSVIFVLSIIGFFQMGCVITDSYTSGLFPTMSRTPFQISYKYLDDLTQNNGLRTINYLTRNSLQYQFSATAYRFIGFPIVGGYGIAYRANLKAASQQNEFLIDLIMPGIVSLKVQKSLLTFIEQAGLSLLLPLAIILRVFPLTRDIGNYAIALLFGLYIIVPLTYVIYASVFYNNYGSNPPIGALSQYNDFAVDAQYWYLAGSLLPQAILLPNLTIVIFITFVTALSKAFRGITV